MGGKSSQETRQQSTTKQDPFYMSIPGLQQTANFVAPQWQNTGATGNENAAFAGLEQNAQAGNPYSSQIGLLANDLFGGGKDRTGMAQGNLDEYRQGLLPYATGSTDPWQNADFTKTVGNVSNDAMDKVKAQYEAAGYNPSAASFGKSVGEGVSNAVAPLAYQAGRDLTQQKLGAIEGLYGAGNTTTGLLSGMDQQTIGNRQAGVGVARDALTAADSPFTRMLDIEGTRRQLPVQNIAQLANLILPLAGVGGTSHTDMYGKTTKEASPMEVAQGWTSVGRNIFGGGSGSAASGVKGWF